jgi:uncharacterized SAM-binding protein YcdF (DUF218 family)
MHLLLSPLTWTLLLGFVLATAWRRLPRSGRAILLILECVLVVVMSPLGANALVWLVESRVPPTSSCADPAPNTIVVLAAGFEREPANTHDLTALDPDNIHRALAGITLWRTIPGATLVLAGGGEYGISESAVLQQFVQQLGVPAQSIRVEDHSHTTWENAAQLRALQPSMPSRIWLVSSALHLPRALVAFRAAGFDACVVVSDRRYIPPGGIGYYLPQSSALRKTEGAIHELVGEAVYRWRAQ